MKPFFIAGAMLLAGSLHAQTLKISGEVKGLTGPVYVMGNKATNSTTDTIPVINGKFAAVIKVNKEPGRRSIMIGRYGFGTWVEPGELRITGDASDMKSFSLAGTPTQDDREKFDRQWDTSMLRMRKRYAEMAEDTTHDTKAVQKMAMSEASAMRHKITVDFIRKHPDSYYSLFLLTEMQEDHQQQMDLYAMLTPRIKASAMGKEFSENIAISKRSANGEKIIAFTRNDLNGVPVSIESYRGKYVLIDFWASWCKPCRMENPNVLEAYNKYKDHNFTVLSITIDDDAEKWKLAVKEDGLPWTQLRDRDNRKSELLDYYGIHAIPSCLLIGPDGTILARNLRGEQLHNKLAELIKI